MEHGFVKVRFPNSENNHNYFFKNGHEGIEVGDTVVVDTVRGLGVAVVTEIPETVERHVGSWVVDVVNFTRFNEIQTIRQAEKEVKARKMELKKKMKSVFDKQVMPDLIEKYAENSPELAEMLKEYKSL